MRTSLRAGLALGLLGQLYVIADLARTMPLFWRTSAHPITVADWAVLFSVLSATAWGAALFYGRSRRAAFASCVACLTSWLYYLVSLGWGYFAAEQHALLYLVPLFPFLFVASGVTLCDAWIAVKPQAAAGSRTVVDTARTAAITLPRLTYSFADNEWVIRLTYGIAAFILLLHQPLFPSPTSRIHDALIWALRGYPSTYNFAWLPICSVAVLVAALILRLSGFREWSRRIALSSGVLGCIYSVLTLMALDHVLEWDRSVALEFGRQVSGGFSDWIALLISLLPVLMSFVLSTRDAAKDESVTDVLMRISACVCFAVSVMAASTTQRKTLPPLFIVLFVVFGFGYLFTAFFPKRLYDYALGASWGQASLVLWFCQMSLRQNHQLDLSVWGIGAANVFLVITTLVSSGARERPLRRLRIVGGFIAALVFAALLIIYSVMGISLLR